MIKRPGILEGLKLMEEYFLRNIVTSELFRPEYECARKINDLLKKNDAIAKSDAVTIVSLFNETNEGEHYSGSGWEDFHMQLAHLLRIRGVNLEVDVRTRRFTIKADGQVE